MGKRVLISAYCSSDRESVTEYIEKYQIAQGDILSITFANGYFVIFYYVEV